MINKKNKQSVRNVLTIVNIIIFSIVLSMSLTSCGDDNNTTNTEFKVTLKLKNEDGQEVTTFNEDDLITFELTIQNQTNSTQTINFSSSYKYDFIIYDTNGQSVWVWSDDKLFTLVSIDLSLEANESKTFSKTWNQEIEDGILMEAGNYKAEGRIIADVQDNTSSQIDFTLQ